MKIKYLLSKYLLLIILFIFVSICKFESIGYSLENNKLNEKLTGQILVDIYEPYLHTGFKLDLADRSLIKYYSYNDYEKYNDKRTKPADFERYNKFVDVFSPSSGVKYRGSIKDELYSKVERYEHERNDNKHRKFEIERYLPNRQVTYTVFNPYGTNNYLIDFNENDICFDFNKYDVRKFQWNPYGNIIAYTYKEKEDGSHKSIAVYDVNGKNILFDKRIGRYIEYFNWDPRSEYLVLLTVESRWSLNPFNIIFAIAGHPESKKQYFLEIYNLKGEQLFNTKILDGVKNGIGRVVWEIQ